MGILNVPAGVSRIHASRRVFQHLATSESDLPIIHPVNLPAAAAAEVRMYGRVLEQHFGYCVVPGRDDLTYSILT